MKFEQNGEWMVSTPIYMGFGSDVERAQACPHESYVETARTVKDGMLVIQERCSRCVAVRGKYRPAKPEEVNSGGDRG